MADAQWIVGIDEAGYGPNLGPLCLAASVWRAPQRLRPESLYDVLKDFVSPTPADGRLIVADSKRLYQGAGGLARLERGALGALARLGHRPGLWRDIWPVIDVQALAQIDEVPWHEGYEEPLPCAATPAEVEQAARLLEKAAQCEVELVALVGSVIFPARFNQQLEERGNKAEVLWTATRGLVQRVLDRCPHLPVWVDADRQGGRRHYRAQLQSWFNQRLVETHQEDGQCSQYRAWEGGRPVVFRFQVQGERLLPVALASMTAKYLRELAMRPLNAFWQRQVRGLAPTAGYPADARRFWQQIQPALKRLRIDPHWLWRQR